MPESGHAGHARPQDEDAAGSQILAQPRGQGLGQAGVKMMQNLAADDDVHGFAQSEGLEDVLTAEIDAATHSGFEPDHVACIAAAQEIALDQ